MKLFSLLSFENLMSSLSVLRTRFPLPTIVVIALAILFFVSVNLESEDTNLYKGILTLIVVFFLSVGVVLFSERNKNTTTRIALNILPVVYGIAFFFTVNPISDWGLESIVFFLLHLTGFIAFLFFAPYLSRLLSSESEGIEYTNYFSRVAWVILMADIVGLSLIILGFVAIASTVALFDLTSLIQEDKFYANWAIVALVIVAPLYALVALPGPGDIDKKKYEVNRFFSFLIRFLTIPFIIIYFFILYAYSVKVLANFSDWPKGEVTWLVVGFSTFGYLSYIFSRPYEDNTMIRLFRKYFPYVVIPQIGMLAYAIWLRIDQYDLTMNRYFVVIFGLWLAGISLYLVISSKKSLALITASLAGLSLIISVGPWSVYSLPLERQYDRLVANLETAGILKDGIIVPLGSPVEISKELSNDIYSGIRYVCDFSECERIKTLFAKELETTIRESQVEWEKNYKGNMDLVYPGISKWEITNFVTSYIKVQESYSYEGSGNNKYIQYSHEYAYDSPFPLQVTGYDEIVRISGGEWSMRPMNYKNGLSRDVYPYISIDPNTSAVAYVRGSGDTIPLIMTGDEKLRLDGVPTRELTQEDLTFQATGEGIEVSLLLQSYAVKNPIYSGTGGYDYYTINGYGLIKKK